MYLYRVMMKRLFLLILCLPLLCTALYAQQIRGLVQDREERSALAGVQIANVHNNEVAYSDSMGNFLIAATKGQLIEFRKAGYLMARVRLSQGFIPPFFKILMDRMAVLNTDRFASSNLTPYQKDSLLTYELYKHALEFPKLSGYQAIQSPFSAMSKKNQQTWAFQDLIEKENKEKYIDYTFNAELITSITGLKGDSLQYYMRRFRPDHDALRRMKLFEFYQYIRRTVDYYRHSRETPRNSR